MTRSSYQQDYQHFADVGGVLGKPPREDARLDTSVYYPIGTTGGQIGCRLLSVDLESHRGLRGLGTTAKVLDAGLNAASTLADNINTRQAQQVVAGTLKNLITQLVRRAYLTCLAIAEPKSDEESGGWCNRRGYGDRGPIRGLFFEFVIQHAAVIREYFAVASHSPQQVQVIDTIEYVRLKLSSAAEQK